jgi:hypothetical protein
MASLRDKMWELMSQVQNDLKAAVVKAETTEAYTDYDAAFQTLRKTERLTKAVRSHIRARMRKALAEMQKVCKHEKRRDGATRYDATTKKSVALEQFCADCKLRLEVDGKVTE